MCKHYVFSDIHGNYNLFEQIKNFLQQDDLCYVLGDCADRGENGYKIIKEVMQDDRFIYIKGNHEDLFASSVLTQDSRYIQCWFQNGGSTTFNDFKEANPPIELVKNINSLPLVATYTNSNDITYIMTHAGFSYGSTEEDRDYIWDREHFLYQDDIPENIILIHGHTPVAYLSDTGIKGEYLKCDNLKNKRAFYSYNNGHKIDIDCGTYASKFIALYCLDDGRIYGFDDERR